MGSRPGVVVMSRRTTLVLSTPPLALIVNHHGASLTALLSYQGQLLLYLRPLVAQIARLLLHHDQVVVELPIEKVVLLPDPCHLLLELVREGQKFRIALMFRLPWILLLLPIVIVVVDVIDRGGSR